MKTITFYDHDNTEVTVQMSSLATDEAFRILLDGEQAPGFDDGLGNKIPVGLHLTRNQAEILIHALQDLFSDE